MPYRKRHSFSPEMAAEEHDLFDSLPDELVISILSKLSSSAGCPLDFITVLMTCKRLNSLALHPLALSKGSSKMFAIKAKNWSESAGRFLKLCADAGNAEACHALLLLVREEQRRKFKEELEKLFKVLEFQLKEYEAFREELGITDIFKSYREKEEQEFKEELKKLDEVLMVRYSVPFFFKVPTGHLFFLGFNIR